MAIVAKLDCGDYIMDDPCFFAPVSKREWEKSQIIKNTDTKDVIKGFKMESRIPVYKPGEGSKLSLYQLKVNLLDEEDKKRHISWAGLLFRFHILFDVNWLARVPSKHCKTHMRVVKTLCRYLAWPMVFSNRYERGEI